MNKVKYSDIFTVKSVTEIQDKDKYINKDRFVICDVAGNVRHDANGYGFTTREKAQNMLNYFSSKFPLDEKDYRFWKKYVYNYYSEKRSPSDGPDLCSGCEIFYYCKGNPKCRDTERRDYVIAKFMENEQENKRKNMYNSFVFA